MYATLQDITDRYGDDELLIAADRNNDGTVDTVAVVQALTDATAEIDTWIGAQYSLPLVFVPAVLKRLCVDIALYRLSTGAAQTEEKRKRYDDALKVLERIARDDIKLGVPKHRQPSTVTPAKVRLIGNARQASRITLKDLL